MGGTGAEDRKEVSGPYDPKRAVGHRTAVA
jgi:hypothetical protein